MSHLLIVNYWGVLAATIASFVLGNIYYMALSKQWMGAHGFNEAQMKENFSTSPLRPMLICFFATLLMALMLYGIMTHMPKFDMRNGIISGILLWAGFVFTTQAINYGFTMKSLKAFVIDTLHWLICLVLQGAVLGWFGK